MNYFRNTAAGSANNSVAAAGAPPPSPPGGDGDKRQPPSSVNVQLLSASMAESRRMLTVRAACQPRVRGKGCAPCAKAKRTCNMMEKEYAQSPRLRRADKTMQALVESGKHVPVPAKSGRGGNMATITHTLSVAIQDWQRARTEAQAQVQQAELLQAMNMGDPGASNDVALNRQAVAGSNIIPVR